LSKNSFDESPGEYELVCHFITQGFKERMNSISRQKVQKGALRVLFPKEKKKDY